MRKILLTILTVTASLCGAEAQKPVAVDGPYIFYNRNNKEGKKGGTMRYVAQTPDGEIVDTTYKMPSRLGFIVSSNDGSHSFPVTIKPGKRHRRMPSQMDVKGDIAVMSDPHGDFDSFLSALQGGGVVGDNLRWSFGKGTLVVIGDVCDRGKDVGTIFWFIEKLKKEARKRGGRVIFQLGNHEDMVLRGDVRYTDNKYKELAAAVGMKVKDLYGPQSEIGRMIRSSNIVSRLNDNIIVHAGLSEEFLRRGLSFDRVNGMVEQYAGTPTKRLKKIGGDVEFVFRTHGPLWHRGMVRDQKKYRPVSEDVVDKILAEYGAERIIVGHTVFDDITSKFGGRVIAVNVDGAENREKGLGRGILISKGGISVIFDDKEPVLLDKYLKNKDMQQRP